MSLNELAANQQRTVQCNTSPDYKFTNDTPLSRENRLGRKEEGQGNQEQIAFKKSHITSNYKEVFPTKTTSGHHFI